MLRSYLNINVYGALLNPGSRFFDIRLGQSTTLTGRTIARHMSAATNEAFTGDYNHVGKSIIYGDTDSFFGTGIIRTNWGHLTVEELFNRGQRYWTDNDDSTKEYSANDDLKVMSFDPDTDQAYYGHTNYIYRHKVTKERWSIEDEDGNIIQITGDHSVMVERNSILMEVKPRDMLETDILITIDDNL